MLLDSRPNQDGVNQEKLGLTSRLSLEQAVPSLSFALKWKMSITNLLFAETNWTAILKCTCTWQSKQVHVCSCGPLDIHDLACWLTTDEMFCWLVKSCRAGDKGVKILRVVKSFNFMLRTILIKRSVHTCLQIQLIISDLPTPSNANLEVLKNKPRKTWRLGPWANLETSKIWLK